MLVNMWDKYETVVSWLRTTSTLPFIEGSTVENGTIVFSLLIGLLMIFVYLRYLVTKPESKTGSVIKGKVKAVKDFVAPGKGPRFRKRDRVAFIGNKAMRNAREFGTMIRGGQGRKRKAVSGLVRSVLTTPSSIMSELRRRKDSKTSSGGSSRRSSSFAKVDFTQDFLMEEDRSYADSTENDLIRQVPEELIVVLKNLRIFGHHDDQTLIDLMKSPEYVSLAKNEYLFRIGDNDDCMYIVQSGVVSVTCQVEPNPHGSPSESDIRSRTSSVSKSSVAESSSNSKVWYDASLLPSSADQLLYIQQAKMSSVELKRVRAGEPIVSLLSFLEHLAGHRKCFRTVTAMALTESRVLKLSFESFKRAFEAAAVRGRDLRRMALLNRKQQQRHFRSTLPKAGIRGPILEESSNKDMSSSGAEEGDDECDTAAVQIAADNCDFIFGNPDFLALMAVDDQTTNNPLVDIVQVIMVRLQRVTLLALHRYLGLGGLELLSKGDRGFAHLINLSVESRSDFDIDLGDEISSEDPKKKMQSDGSIPSSFSTSPPPTQTNHSHSLDELLTLKVFQNMREELKERQKLNGGSSESKNDHRNNQNEDKIWKNKVAIPLFTNLFFGHGQMHVDNKNDLQGQSRNNQTDSPKFKETKEEDTDCCSTSTPLTGDLREAFESAMKSEMRILYYQRGECLVLEETHAGISSNKKDMDSNGSSSRSTSYYASLNAAADVYGGFGVESDTDKSRLYLVLSGCVAVSQVDTDGRVRQMYKAYPGAFLGQLQVLTCEAPFFSYTSDSIECKVATISGKMIRKLMNRDSNIALRLAISVISQLSADIRSVDFCLEWSLVESGRALYKQDAIADSTFVVLSGRLRSVSCRPILNIHEQNQNDDNENGVGSGGGGMRYRKQLITEYGRGELTGIVETLMKTRRTTTVIAVRDTEVTRLPGGLIDFVRLKFPNVMMRLIKLLGEKLLERQGKSSSDWDNNKSNFPNSTNVSTPSPYSNSSSLLNTSSNSASSFYSPNQNTNISTVALIARDGETPITAFALELVHALNFIKLQGSSSGSTGLSGPVSGSNVGGTSSSTNPPHAQAVRLTLPIVKAELGQNALNKSNDYRLSSWLGHMEDRHRIVVYQCEPSLTHWTKLALRHADVIFIVIDSQRENSDVDKIEEGLDYTAKRTRKELILLHREEVRYPSNTHVWLNKRRRLVQAHYHIKCPKRMFFKKTRQRIETMYHNRMRRQSMLPPSISLNSAAASAAVSDDLSIEPPPPSPSNLTSNPSNMIDIHSDFARLARMLTGTTVGLVLSGGGARGFAHVGMIKSILESNIPIDFICGVSMGSFIGAIYAQERDVTGMTVKARKFAYKMSQRWRILLDLTYPHTAYMTGQNFNLLIRETFTSDRDIRDLWLPYFTITTDVTLSSMRIHDYGSLWRYVRSSMSLAGYLPPLCDPIDGHLLLDGGYVNNLPADVMRQRGANHIMAIDVGGQTDVDFTNYGDSISGFDVLWDKFNPFKAFWKTSPPLKVPNQADIQSLLAYVSCVNQLEQVRNSNYCDYIRPPIDRYSTLQFGAFEEINEVGYNHGKTYFAGLHKANLLRSYIRTDVLHFFLTNGGGVADNNGRDGARHTSTLLRRETRRIDSVYNEPIDREKRSKNSSSLLNKSFPKGKFSRSSSSSSLRELLEEDLISTCDDESDATAAVNILNEGGEEEGAHCISGSTRELDGEFEDDYDEREGGGGGVSDRDFASSSHLRSVKRCESVDSQTSWSDDQLQISQRIGSARSQTLRDVEDQRSNEEEESNLSTILPNTSGEDTDYEEQRLLSREELAPM